MRQHDPHVADVPEMQPSFGIPLLDAWVEAHYVVGRLADNHDAFDDRTLSFPIEQELLFRQHSEVASDVSKSFPDVLKPFRNATGFVAHTGVASARTF